MSIHSEAPLMVCHLNIAPQSVYFFKSRAMSYKLEQAQVKEKWHRSGNKEGYVKITCGGRFNTLSFGSLLMFLKGFIWNTYTKCMCRDIGKYYWTVNGMKRNGKGEQKRFLHSLILETEDKLKLWNRQQSLTKAHLTALKILISKNNIS